MVSERAKKTSHQLQGIWHSAMWWCWDCDRETSGVNEIERREEWDNQGTRHDNNIQLSRTSLCDSLLHLRSSQSIRFLERQLAKTLSGINRRGDFWRNVICRDTGEHGNDKQLLNYETVRCLVSEMEKGWHLWQIIWMPISCYWNCWIMKASDSRERHSE